MGKKKNIEWLAGDEKELEYHTKQYENPKEYTKQINNYLAEWGLVTGDNIKILDAGCGAGANCNYFALNYSEAQFDGVDLNKKYIKIANKLRKENNKFYSGDLTDYKFAKKYNGVLCLQTLSWMDGYKKVVKNFFKNKPEWILLTSLFYNGPVETKIKIKDYSRTMGHEKYRSSFYNIYSLDLLKKFVEKNNYKIERAVPFEIPFDLNKSNDQGMGTYTLKLEDGKRLQVSGPLLMPWHTILITKN